MALFTQIKKVHDYGRFCLLLSQNLSHRRITMITWRSILSPRLYTVCVRVRRGEMFIILRSVHDWWIRVQLYDVIINQLHSPKNFDSSMKHYTKLLYLHWLCMHCQVTWNEISSLDSRPIANKYAHGCLLYICHIINGFTYDAFFLR